MERDSKKNRKPFEAADFCFFLDVEENRPKARAAAAYMALVKSERLPEWATWIYADMKDGKGKVYLGDPAMMGDGVILLAPTEIDGGFRGLLLAEAKVSGRQIEMVWRDMVHLLAIPKFDSFFYAEDEVDLDLLMPPWAPPGGPP
jgi:hypothetical protein